MRVTISERAEKNLDDMVHYLDAEWSVRIRKKFLDLLLKKIEMIKQMPLMYEASLTKKTIRLCVVNKQTSMYYRVKKDEIEIVTIQSNRKNPKKLKL